MIVGLGASAGALAALERFFSVVPANSGLVFVVVQHLERHHPSVLAELLGKHTQMPVRQAEDQQRILADHVYIIQPNSVLTVEKGHLRVRRAADLGLRSPIDAFLRSLAVDRGERAIGIVLSGAGSDGTAGLRAIKEHGGLTLAQAPATAAYDSMPQSAIAAGLVDLVLPVEDMPPRLVAYARCVADAQRAGDEHFDAQLKAHLGSICEILEQQSGHDFSRYKGGTLLRRIRRRIQIQQSATVEDYVRYLRAEPAEARALHQDLLIGVTHFFRDPEVFAALASQTLPAIVEQGAPGSTVRLWVPGCASGEEAYSLAILVREHLARVDAARSVQIFATDIDSELLAMARAGRYPERIAEHVSAERLERFFVHENDSYRVSSDLRSMCTFSEHSLIKDPPFSSLDLISCRNVLIYLSAELQKKLVPLFHYALRPGGFLLLGPSESIAAHAELFATVDKTLRLFRRKEGVVRPSFEFPLTGRGQAPPPPAPPREQGAPISLQTFSHAFERMILEEYAPPSAVINERGDILYLAGRAGRYLQVAAGTPSNNIFDLAEAGLRVELRSALAKAVDKGRKLVRERVPVQMNGEQHLLRLTARPLAGVPSSSGLYAIVLQSVGSFADVADEDELAASPELPIVEQLENELRTTRADLQSALLDLETANEELKSSNEELISTNEELHSSNEELQTSKEELQSANDELHTKVIELDSANNDLQHHFAGTNIITIFLDSDLRIRRCTPAASKLFNVLEGDVGRPFRDLAPRFVEGDVLADICSVLQSGMGIERQVHRSDGDCSRFLVRVLPYRAHDNTVTGVGVTFVDISNVVRAEEAERRYAKLLQLSPDAMFVWRLDGGIETWNRGAEELYGFTLEEARGQAPQRLVRARWPHPWPEIEAALRESGRWDGEVGYCTKDARLLTTSSRLLLMHGEDGIDRVLESTRDITERKAAEVERERLIGALREGDQRKNEFLAMLSHELRNPLAPIRNSLFILDRAAPGGEQARRAQAVIDRQVSQLTRIVDDLLDVTRITRGKLQVQPTRLELGDLLRRTVEDHRSVIANAGLELEVSTGEQPLWVNGDPARLAQAIGNLLSNTAKFTGRGGHVRVALDGDEAREMAVIRVQDDGAGISRQLLARMFEPFAQADRTLDRSRGGLGLGLALVKGLVEQHGGEVKAESDGPGKGSVFTIRLPLVDLLSDVETAAASPHTRAVRRVLVIEDNLDAAESLREALELAQHEVAVAHSGPEGMAKARELKPEVVLCDIGLPGMDGYEVARALRADDDLRSVYLVALTGYALPEDLAKAMDAGFDHHIAKPPTIEKLEEVLSAEHVRFN